MLVQNIHWLILSPRFLPKSFTELAEQLERAAVASRRSVQVDVVDGVFAPNSTWPYTDENTFENISVRGMPCGKISISNSIVMVPAPESKSSSAVAPRASSCMWTRGRRRRCAADASSRRASGEACNVAVGRRAAVRATRSDEHSKHLIGLFDFVQVMGIDRSASKASRSTASRERALVASCASVSRAYNTS